MVFFLQYSKILIVLILILFLKAGYAQEKRTPLYIDLNKSDYKIVHQVPTNVLSVQYHDALGRAKEIDLRIYDWKRDVVAELVLSKSPGLNYFNIRIDDIVMLEREKTYTCETTDEMGRNLGFAFRLKTPPERKEIMANIFVNPKYLKCDDPQNNFVEFYGEVAGGKAPYTINWYVLNNYRTALLYQPKEQHIERAGATAMVQITKEPDYFVILYVKDACGVEQHQVVHLVCEKGKKKVNTVFFETMTDVTKTKITQ